MKKAKGPTQHRKADEAHTYVEAHKVPSTEKSTPRETQPRKAEDAKGKNKQAPKPAQETMHPENFSRYGTNFTVTNMSKKGL